MPTYLDRYQAGDRQAVWTELVSLGRAAYEEPVYADALAVARETMARAQSNVETLLVRLNEIDYQFQTARKSDDVVLLIQQIQQSLRQQQLAQFPELPPGFFADEPVLAGLLDGFDPQRTPANILEEKSVYIRALPGIQSRGLALEGYLGTSFPLSLKAWYERVQHVHFLGSHPVLNPENAMLGDILPDPFVLGSLPDEIDYESWETEEGYPIAVDEFFKADIPSEERYSVNFRDSRADTRFRDWKNDYFVEYLRRVFRWGGFPGWERHANPPRALIAQLTEGLLEI